MTIWHFIQLSISLNWWIFVLIKLFNVVFTFLSGTLMLFFECVLIFDLTLVTFAANF